MRILTLLVALALPATLLAGCTAPDDPPAAAPPAAPPAGSGGSGAGASSPPAQEPPKPVVAPVQDAGDIQGPFEKSWRLEVPSVAFRETHVDFALAGAQPGAPPTARVQLSLLNPEGKVVKTGAAGLGAEGDRISWVLRAADMPAAGTYTLQAVSAAASPGSLPSAGLAKYTLHAEVLY